MRLLRTCLIGGCLLAALSGAGSQDAATPPAPSGPSAGASAKGPHHIYLVGNLLVTEPWLAVDAQSTDQASAYVVIQSRGGAPDRLLSASTDAADRIVFDANGAAPGVGDGSLVIPPRQTVTLDPNGVHFQFEGLHRDIRNDPVVPCVLVFEQAGPLHVDFSTTRGQVTAEQPAEPAGNEAPSLVK